MAVKRYDGSAWQVVAGDGVQGAPGAAATSSTITTWVKTASGGETSLSGNDDSAQALSYTIGQELVFINGVLQKRGVDYVATTGNTIASLAALTANDVVTVWSTTAFSVSNAISNTLLTTTGDLVYASSANVPARLGVGSTGQVLTVSGGVPTWAAASTGIVKQIVFASTTTGVSVVNTTTYADTALSATITPTSSTSTILVIINQTMSAERNSSGVYAKLRLLRGATSIIEWLGEAFGMEAAAASVTYNKLSTTRTMSYLDSPATTSATTYKTQGACNTTGSDNTIGFQGRGSGLQSSMILIEIGA